MFSIGEFARLGTVSVRTLRHYDEIGLLRPARVDPVAEPPAELSAPATYLVLPEVEAVVAVRNGPAASIFPMVYHDLVQWADAHGYQTSGPGREVWVNAAQPAVRQGPGPGWPQARRSPCS